MSVVLFYRIKHDEYGWMLPEEEWYHGQMTFTDTISNAKTCTLLECENYLARSDCPEGAYHEAILPV